jgi:hypothetical protein
MTKIPISAAMVIPKIGDKGRDEHTCAGEFGQQQAKQRKSDYADLTERFCHPSLAVGEAEQPSADEAYPPSDKHTIANLLHDELHEARGRTFGLCGDRKKSKNSLLFKMLLLFIAKTSIRSTAISGDESCSQV